MSTELAPGQLVLFHGVDLEEYEKGKDELTLAEFPLALAGKNPSNKGQTSVTYRDQIRDKGTGKDVLRTITIEGSEMFGLPTYYDEEVLFGILQLTNLKRNGDDWPLEVRFSRYHLAKILGLKTDGRTYRRLWDSLHRLANTTYNFHFAFFDKEDAEWRPSVVINFIQTLKVHGGPVPGRNGEVTIRWNEDIHRNFQAGYLRDINFTEYRLMGLPLAKALYRFLGKRFWRSSRLRFDLHVLAYEKLGLSRSYNTGQIKRALQDAINRLEERGFIRPATREERYQKVQKGVWNVYFEKLTPQQSLPMAVEPQSELEAKLIEREVSAGVASELVSKFPEDFIARKIDEFDHQLRTGTNEVLNKGGYLAKSIREQWASPTGYKSPEELLRERQANEKRQEAVRLREEQKKAAEAEYKRIRGIRDQSIDSYLKALDENEREELTAEVIGPDPDRISRSLSKGLVRCHVGEMLEQKGEIPPEPEEPK